MQHRMRTHPLTAQQVDQLLQRAQTGSLATLNFDGTPYSTPVHFVYSDNAIFIHGLPKGKKLDNIARDCRVGFSVHEMDRLLLDPNGKPCGTNTKYESVIISGTARVMDSIEERRDALQGIVAKYTPHLANEEIPDDIVKSTAVIRVDVVEMTGKYYS